MNCSLPQLHYGHMISFNSMYTVYIYCKKKMSAWTGKMYSKIVQFVNVCIYVYIYVICMDDLGCAINQCLRSAMFPTRLEVVTCMTLQLRSGSFTLAQGHGRKNKCLAAHGSWRVRTPSHTSFGLVRNHSYWWYTYLGWSFIIEATLVAELQGPSGGPFESPVQS